MTAVRLQPWALMWAMAAAIFGVSKWLTWGQGRVVECPAWRNWAYWFAWPGLDARDFLGAHKPAGRPATISWIGALLKTFLGAVLLWRIAPVVPASQMLLQGWIGMTGMIFLLHFGLFHLLALGWQELGVNAAPLMCSPIRATSVADFWGRRWNSAFNRLAHNLVFRPLHRRIGTPAATLLVFLASGLVHELVISVPAGAGYGLPTSYFLAQGTGLLFEGSALGRRLGLRRGIRGRCFALGLAGIPAFWLFHPPFVERVIIPFMQFIHAT